MNACALVRLLLCIPFRLPVAAANPPVTMCNAGARSGNAVTAQPAPPLHVSARRSPRKRYTMEHFPMKFTQGWVYVGLANACYPPLPARQRRRRRLLVTTETELSAIAIAASIGLRKPLSPSAQRRPAGTPPSPNAA